jgi:hypothetical protein
MVGAVSHDSFSSTDAGAAPGSPTASSRDGAASGPRPLAAPEGEEAPARRKGFAIDAGGAAGPLGCADVQGFREAVVAALNPDASAPSRLALVAPEAATVAWLEDWAEDVAQVRRTLDVSRRLDGEAITVVATLASHGHGVDTSLAVESVRAPGRDDLFRSGVHARADVEAALARFDAGVWGGANDDGGPPG